MSAATVAATSSASRLPVLRSKARLKISFARLEALLAELRRLGLDGVEAHYPDHPTPFRDRLLALAGDLGLAVSGGSDFHGSAKPGVRLGVGKGSLRVPAAVLEGLKARLADRPGEKNPMP